MYELPSCNLELREFSKNNCLKSIFQNVLKKLITIYFFLDYGNGDTGNMLSAKKIILKETNIRVWKSRQIFFLNILFTFTFSPIRISFNRILNFLELE